MMLCLVTDRRRLGTAIGARPEDWIDALVEQVAAAARAGVDFIQVREPDLEARDLATLVRTLLRAGEGTSARILVNDRVDVALATKAAGAHLKEASFSPGEVRRIVPHGFIIGCSVHEPAGASARCSADYLIAGTVRPTVSKRPADYLEWEGLKAVVDAAHGTPVLGIGGLDVRSIPVLAASCAAGLAAIGAFIPPAGQPLRPWVQKRVEDMRFAFDSTRPGR